MKVDTLGDWAEALLVITSILGIMALIWIGLCVINQKHDKKMKSKGDPEDSNNYNSD